MYEIFKPAISQLPHYFFALPYAISHYKPVVGLVNLLMYYVSRKVDIYAPRKFQNSRIRLK